MRLRRLLGNLLEGRKRKQRRVINYEEAIDLIDNLRVSQLEGKIELTENLRVSRIRHILRKRIKTELTREEALLFLEENFGYDSEMCDAKFFYELYQSFDEDMHYLEFKGRYDKVSIKYKTNDNVNFI